MTDKINMAELIAKAEEAYASNQDINNMQSLKFLDKWKSVKVDVPVAFLNFTSICDAIEARDKFALGAWDERVPDHDAVKAIVGPEIGAVVIDYVETNRLSQILQYLNVAASLEAIDLVMTETGEKYIVNQEKADQLDPLMAQSLNRFIEAYEHLR